MMKKRGFAGSKPWWMLLWAISFSSVTAQQRFHFRHLSTGDGLSQGSVISMAQDDKGLLWFGTRDGLNIYDGKNFTVYRNDPKDSTTISNNDVLDVLVDDQGDLWIGTYNGLNRYCYSEGRFYQFFNSKNDPKSLANNSVWTLCQTTNGELWVGTGGGVNVYKDGQFQRIVNNPNDPESLSKNYAVEVFQDSGGQIWVGTSNGLNRLISRGEDGFKFERYYAEVDNPNALHNNFVQVINEDEQGNLWLGTRGGLHKYDQEANRFTRFLHGEANESTISHNDVRSLTFDQDGTLWVGTYNGLNKMSIEGEFTRITNDPNIPHSLSKNTIKSTFMDRKGTLWVGVYYGGINMLDETNGNFTNYEHRPSGNGLSYDVVSSVVEGSNGQVYIGTEGGGINFLNPSTGKVSSLSTDNSGLSNNNIKALFLDHQDLWVGTLSRGIDIYNTRTGKFTTHYSTQNGLVHNSVYAILRENDSLMWIGTFGGGLHLFNQNTQQLRIFQHDINEPTGISDNQVRLICRDGQGNLWVGTQYGLNLLHAEDISNGNYEFERYFYDDQKKSGEDILVIYEDGQERIWVGTYESGLSLYDPMERKFVSYQLFDASQGVSNVVHGILEDEDHNLWVSSNHGITRVNLTDSSKLTFDQSDGLVSNEFNNNSSYKSSDGRMYFGGPQGLTAFYPQNIKTNHYAPNTVITDFKVYNQSVKVGAEDGILSKSIIETDRLTLDYDQAIFSIEFAIPNFINPDKNRYQYRLSGLEDHWNITSKTTATYTIQRPGTYTFEVKGANNDGIWSDEITSLQITVNPAPWRTWWAFVIYMVIVIVSLYLLTSIILSRSRLRHQLELEHLEHERQQSIHQMKLRFFTNISHEFRTPLTLILGPLEQILQEYRGSNKVYKQLKVMEKNSVRLLKLVNQLLDFRKFENQHEKLQAGEGNVVKFVEEIFLSFKQYAKIHNITYELEKVDESIVVWYDRDKMERVFYNLISNAFKYTPESGEIRVKVWQEAGQMKCTISDTGIGLDQEHIDRIFDRFYEVQDTMASPKHKHQKGTGIGLAIARSVVEMHSGSIAVESKKGIGTTFTICLPQGDAHLTDDQRIRDFKDSEDLSTYHEINRPEMEESEKDQTQLAMADESLPCILVVEDNDPVRKFIVDVFRDSYRVEEAANGMEGFKKAVQIVPDLVISDVMMPKMDGIEFCYQAKSNLKTSHIPFILLTARTSLIFKFEGLESGADEYINKPFNVKELKLKARNLINTFHKMRDKFSDESIVKPAEITVSSIDEKLLKRALAIVEENISNEFFNIQLFSSELGVSRTMLFTKVKAWTNLTPNEFIHSMRMKRAAQILEQNKVTISEVSYQVGFNNPKYFSKCFQKYHGSTPSEYAGKFSIVED